MTELAERLAADTLALIDVASESRDEGAILNTIRSRVAAAPDSGSSMTTTVSSQRSRNVVRGGRWCWWPGTWTRCRWRGRRAPGVVTGTSWSAGAPPT